MQGDSDLPKAPLGNNFRPIQALNQRFLRTNIDFKKGPVSYGPVSVVPSMRYGH